MSKAQQDMTEIYERHKGTAGNLLGRVMAKDRKTQIQESIGLKGFHAFALNNISVLVRMGRARFDGKDPWPTAKDAMEETVDFLNDKFYELLIQVLAMGAFVGFNQNNPDMKDYDWNTLPFDDDHWPAVLKYRDQFSSDKDVLEFIGERMGECASSFAQLGFLAATGKETCHVWDLWRESLKSTSFVLYRVGTEVGRRWWDEEVLAGIERAMEE